MKVLVAVDFSSGSEKVLRNVEATPWPAATAIRLLHVIDLAPFPLGLLVIGDAKQAANEAIGVAARKVEAPGIAVDTEILVGTPRAAIVNEARRSNSNLVVLGSHGWHGLDRLLMGSVSEYVAVHAPCSVMVVPPPK